MPNGHSPKEYGKHKYPNPDGTSDCQYGCGCWMGPSRSGGPTGLDPFGICPKNPVDGILFGGAADYDNVVTERIRSLESKLHRAEERLKRVSPSKAKLADELATTKAELAEKNKILGQMHQIIKDGTDGVSD
ncbi:MAG: hypothetical protein AAB866_01115 [Patescibacteria group bacterium]